MNTVMAHFNNLLKRFTSSKTKNMEAIYYKVEEPLAFYDLTEKLGQGAFAYIYKGKKKRGSRKLSSENTKAIKILPIIDTAKVEANDNKEEREEADEGYRVRAKETDLERALKEVRITQALQHSSKYIIQLREAFYKHTNPREIWMVTDLYDIDLRHLLDLIGKIDHNEIMTISYCLAQAIKDIHGQNIIHGDIKATNVLVSRSGNIVLCDFGIAEQLSDRTDALKLNKFQGTLYWCAKELLGDKGTEYSFPIDIWAYGCTLSELIQGKSPFEGRTQDKLALVMWMRETWSQYDMFKLGLVDGNLANFPEGERKPMQKEINEVPPFDENKKNICELIKECIHLDASARPSIEDILSSPLFQDFKGDDTSKIRREISSLVERLLSLNETIENFGNRKAKQEIDAKRTDRFGFELEKVPYATNYCLW